MDVSFGDNKKYQQIELALGLGSLSTHLQTIGWYNDNKIVSLIFARDSFERERERERFGLLEIAFVPLLSLYFLNETFISSLSMNVGNRAGLRLRPLRQSPRAPVIEKGPQILG